MGCRLGRWIVVLTTAPGGLQGSARKCDVVKAGFQSTLSHRAGGGGLLLPAGERGPSVANQEPRPRRTACEILVLITFSDKGELLVGDTIRHNDDMIFLPLRLTEAPNGPVSVRATNPFNVLAACAFCGLWLLGACADLSVAKKAYEQGDIEEAHKNLAPLAEFGIAEAQYRLARLYLEHPEEADGVGADGAGGDGEAASWLRAANQQGHKSAPYHLARLYQKGRGVDRDLARAVDLYETAEARGHSGAPLALGDVYAREDEVRDYALAVQWYRRATEKGSARASYELGRLHEAGSGVDQSNTAAAEQYALAAAGGYAKAGFQLANLYASGALPPNGAEQAAVWYEKAAKAGYPRAGFALAELLLARSQRTDDVEEAMAWYQAAADGGYPRAYFAMAEIHRQGALLDQDRARARALYGLAAEQGYARAAFRIGQMLEAGEISGGPTEGAALWYRKAGRGGYTRAFYYLGKLYVKGFGVPRDTIRALAYFDVAAAYGHGASARRSETLRRQLDARSVGDASALSEALFSHLDQQGFERPTPETSE